MIYESWRNAAILGAIGLVVAAFAHLRVSRPVFPVLVVAADQPDVQAPARLRDAMQGAGGRVAGVFFNRTQVETPGFMRAFLR